MGVTLKQLAEELGISLPAVSQILNARGRFADETRRRVFAAAKKHGYRPNAAARSLQGQSSKMVGVLFRNDVGNPMTNMTAFEYLLGINQRFQDADYGTLVIRAGEIAQAGDLEPRVFRERLVDGVIVVGTLPEPLIKRVRNLSQRVVWVDAPVWEPTCCVRRDERAAGQACARALAELGYESIVFVHRSSNRLGHHSHGLREAGARAAAKAGRVQFRSNITPEMSYAAEYDYLRRLLECGEGIIAGTLPAARRITFGAAGLQKVMGFDFGMVCCDDSVDTQTGWPALGRVRFDRYALGIEAAGMMLKLLEAPDAPPKSLLQSDTFVAGSSAWGPAFPPRRTDGNTPAAKMTRRRT